MGTEANLHRKEQPFAVGDTVLWISSVNGISPVSGRVVDDLRASGFAVIVKWPHSGPYAIHSTEWTGNLLLVLPLLDEWALEEDEE